MYRPNDWGVTIMNITYREDRNFNKTELEQLFLSVDWASGKYPDRLMKALTNCESVFSAYDGDKLIGLINAVDDGAMMAYIHYLLVLPEYQSKGVGKTLLKKMIDRYKDYPHLFLLAENQGLIKYYESHGFAIEKEKTAMAIDKM